MRVMARARVAEDVYLVGFSGSGKSTVGPKLARQLKVAFYDTDAIIEDRSGVTIERIFKERGERAFRSMEHEVIRELAKRRDPKVVALGGGALIRRDNRSLVKRGGLMIYLSCSVAEIYRRMKNKRDRPLLRIARTGDKNRRQVTIERIRTILDKRLAHYMTADRRLSTSARSVRETVDRLYRMVLEHNA